MSDYLVVPNIERVLTARALPLVTVWNRLEGRPRTTDFSRALQAQIRDPLWMLSKQWQMGEFEGDDAGSPVAAKLRTTSNRLHRYRAGQGSAEEFEENVPLEAKVERRPVRLSTSEGKLALDLRLMLGRRWMKMIASFPAAVHDQYLAHDDYRFELPDPDDAADAPLVAHSDVWQKLSACAGRLMDGGALVEHLRADTSHTAADGIAGLSSSQETDLSDAGKRLVAWFEELFYQPEDGGDEAWQPSHLEYQFACASPEESAEKILTAEEYFHGRLDWYNLDSDPALESLGTVSGADPPPEPVRTTLSFLPTPMIFNGMPNTRWWELEDRRTSLGFVDPATTDIAKLLVVEFGLVYANDWFLVPLTLPVGSIARVDGLEVTNVFGERIWVEAAGRGLDDDWQRWNMYGISVAGDDDAEADNSLLLLPTVPKIQESEPLEEVVFVRDEMANMAWGIEARVPLMSGVSRPGGETATQLRRVHRRLVEQAGGAPMTPEIENEARIRYKIMRSPPENWIPFVPVHVEGSNREVQLQRAALPRVIEGDPDAPLPVRPRTTLLREGRDEEPVREYLVFEEEITRAGVRLLQTFQRSRWRHGEVFNWLGIRKHTGRGEAYGNLAFDQIMPKRSADAGSGG